MSPSLVFIAIRLQARFWEFNRGTNFLIIRNTLKVAKLLMVVDVYSALFLLFYWLNEKCEAQAKVMRQVKKVQPISPHANTTLEAGSQCHCNRQKINGLKWINR